jgi:hypothetical protein
MADFSLTSILNKTPSLIPDLLTSTTFDIEGTFAEAEKAVTVASRMISAGADIQQCVPELFKFFKAQGEIDAFAAREKANFIASDKKKARRKKTSAEDEFIAITRARKLQELETNIKDLLIYSGNSDIYKEMCAVRQEIFLDREHERIQEIKEQERIRHEKARLRAKRLQRIEDIITLAIGGVVIAGMLYGIWWMLSLVLAAPK